MKATEADVRAWVNVPVWDDEVEAERAVQAILASGTDDEAEWVRLAGGGQDDVAAAAERDAVRRSEQYEVRDIADALGVKPATVRQWKRRDRLPPPSGRVGQSPWWAPGVIGPWIDRERAVRAERSE